MKLTLLFWVLPERRDELKNGKKPTKKQKLIMKTHGLDPARWLVVKNLGRSIEVVSKIALKKGGRARTRILNIE